MGKSVAQMPILSMPRTMPHLFGFACRPQTLLQNRRKASRDANFLATRKAQVRGEKRSFLRLVCYWPIRTLGRAEEASQYHRYVTQNC